MAGDTPALQSDQASRTHKTSRTHFLSSRGPKPTNLPFAESSTKFAPSRSSVRSFAVFAAQDDTARGKQTCNQRLAEQTERPLKRRWFGNRRFLKRKYPSQKHRAPAKL